jgi:hypothetical protein
VGTSNLKILLSAKAVKWKIILIFQAGLLISI